MRIPKPVSKSRFDSSKRSECDLNEQTVSEKYSAAAADGRIRRQFQYCIWLVHALVLVVYFSENYRAA